MRNRQSRLPIWSMAWLMNNSRICRDKLEHSTQWWRIWIRIWWGRQVKWWKTCRQSKWLRCNRWQLVWWAVVECRGWEECQECQGWECPDRRRLNSSNLQAWTDPKLWQLLRRKFYRMISKPIWARLKVWRVPQTHSSRNKSTKRHVSNTSHP